VNGPLFRHTFRSNAIKLLLVGAGLALMGVIMPVMFAAFGKEVGAFVQSVPLLDQLSDFGEADFFTLSGSVAAGFTHPFTLLLLGIIAVAFPALAIAGERDKGTLEVTLSRPISRNGLLLTLFLAGLIFIGILVAVLMVSSIITTYAVGLGHELQLANTVQLWLVAWLLFAAFMSLTFAVSVGSDRAAPAFGIPATIILLSYLVWAIASIWPDVRWLGEYTVFHLVKAQETLDDGPAAADVLILLGLSVVFMGIALYRFPRRDLPAPS